ncbi:MAG: DUF3105 domain-containing protein [Salinibacterium sp.]|nr:DUF3105 domain-containing protein [Salinibacterium sp.]
MPTSNDRSGLTIKQQREARRAVKVAALKRQQATQTRNQRIGLIAGIGASVAVVAAIVVVIVTSSVPRPDPADITVEGLQEFTGITAVHVGPEPVDYLAKYDMNPPAGGDHFAAWLNCGVYDQPQPNENAVHSLEHGAVWVTYDPDRVDQAGVDALRGAIPSTYMILSPYPGLPSSVVASAWSAQVELDGVDDERLGLFIDKFWKSASTPEPGGSCSGAVDGPGRVA